MRVASKRLVLMYLSKPTIGVTYTATLPELISSASATLPPFGLTLSLGNVKFYNKHYSRHFQGCSTPPFLSGLQVQERQGWQALLMTRNMDQRGAKKGLNEYTLQAQL